MIGLIVVGAIGIIGWALPGSKNQQNISLGQWKNMPSGTSFPFCTSANITDACELMSQSTSLPLVLNQSYRGILAPPNTPLNPLNVKMSVGCVKPSNTVGAYLQLQYANYSMITNTNTSLFTTLNSNTRVLIDNSANSACPGVGIVGPKTNNGANLISSGGAYIFRVVGVGGGGVGDNPRFSDITVEVSSSTFLRIFYYRTTAKSSTSFTTQVSAEFTITTVPVTLTFDWMATNQTSTVCGTGDLCLESGTASCVDSISGSTGCSATTTFPVAFTGTPAITYGGQSAISGAFLPLGTINLLKAQTLTV